MAANKKKISLEADGRVWMGTSEGKLAGKGRIELMEKIQESGSIRQAALSMKMSYHQAWELVADMNTLAKEPLIISHRGGKGGGYAELTEKGQQLIVAFRSFEKRFQSFLKKESEKFIF